MHSHLFLSLQAPSIGSQQSLSACEGGHTVPARDHLLCSGASKTSIILMTKGLKGRLDVELHSPDLT
ncbi:hypothetical protein AMECASPLE_037249 [Ameca splendens]|uniref:Uncharacterized protein n=1 Tax=Ameca splendens TaxID=208324 RepID=A0ABV0Y8I7_9TELE